MQHGDISGNRLPPEEKKLTPTHKGTRFSATVALFCSLCFFISTAALADGGTAGGGCCQNTGAVLTNNGGTFTQDPCTLISTPTSLSCPLMGAMFGQPEDPPPLVEPPMIPPPADPPVAPPTPPVAQTGPPGTGGGTPPMPPAPPPVLGNGTIYYVSPDGSDSGTGTIDSPWKSISHAVSQLKAGDTLYLRGGTYNELVYEGASGTSTNPITIMAYNGEKPIIDGAGIAAPDWSALLSINGDYVHVYGLELKNMDLNGSGQGGAGLILTGTGNTATNMLVHDIWGAAIDLQGNNLVLQDSVVYHAGLSNCRLSDAACGVTTSSRESTWPGVVAIEQPYGTGLVAQNDTIQRVTVYDSWGEGLSAFDTNGAVIQDSVAYNNWSENMYLNLSTNATIQRNIVYNAPDGYMTSPSAGFALADEMNSNPPHNLASNNTVINNLVYNTNVSLYGWTEVSGTGLVNDVFANNTVINGSVSTGSGGGMNITNSNSVIANNLISGGTLNVPNATGLTLSNNLVTANPGIAALGGTGAGQLSSAYFILQPTSPAIGQGVVLPQVPANFFGVTNSPPNIGGD